MQKQDNYHRYLWLLSGTGEGPYIAEAFLSKGWKVSVSVVTPQAALAYASLPLDNLWIGALAGTEEIQRIIEQGPSTYKKFDLVLDATHPFATQITLNLYKTCLKLKQEIVRFDRPLIAPEWAYYISDVEDLLVKNFEGQRLLFAIGSRNLGKIIPSLKKKGTIVFARVLPNPISIREALSANLSNEFLAVLKPLQGARVGEYESALCKKWSITGVVCRQSGGSTQEIWQSICKDLGIDLWLISRPKKINEINTIKKIEEILEDKTYNLI